MYGNVATSYQHTDGIIHDKPQHIMYGNIFCDDN